MRIIRWFRIKVLGQIERPKDKECVICGSKPKWGYDHCDEFFCSWGCMAHMIGE